MNNTYLGKLTCPYCMKNKIDHAVYHTMTYYFCDSCFQKWFGMTFEQYKKISDRDCIHKRMFHNYKTHKPFLVVGPDNNIVDKCFFKNGILSQQ